MGYVSKTNSIGDAVSTLTFENYEDFMRHEGRLLDEKDDYFYKGFKLPPEYKNEDQLNEYQLKMLQAFKKEADRFLKEQSYETTPQRQIVFTEQEYYYLCILVGHLKPGGTVVQSLLDKFDLPLDCEDYDKLNVESEHGCNVLKLNEEENV